MTRRRIWFEDYELGEEITSPARRIYESDVLGYVRFTNDIRSVMHSNGPPTETLSVPDPYLFALGICLLLHTEDTYIPREFVAFYGFDSIQFHAPTTVGQVISSVARVTGLEPRGDKGVVSLRHETKGADGVCLVSSDQRILVRSRPEEPAQ
jgi:acyl dehydratase